MKIRFTACGSSLMVLTVLATNSFSPTEAVAKAKSSPTVITMWHEWSGLEAKDVHQLVLDFNRTHPDIQVKDLSNTTDQKMLTAMTGGTPPDLAITANAPSIVQWSKVGALLPLDSYIKKTNFQLSNVPAALRAPGEFQGSTYGLPVETDTYMLFYNKKLFKEAGITRPPQTFEELQQDAKKLTKRGPNGYQTLGFIPDYPWLDPFMLPAMYGGNFWNAKTKQLTPDNLNVIAALQFEKSFYSAPYNLQDIKKFKSGFGKYGSPNDPFFTGQLAMTWNGEWWPMYIKNAAPNLDYGMAPMPYPKNHPELKNTMTTGPEMIFIPRNSGHADAAWTFIQWLLQTENLVKFNAGMSGLPTTFTALKSPELGKLNPGLIPFAKLLSGGKLVSFPNLTFQNEYLNQLGLDEQKVLDLQETPQQAMNDVKSKMAPIAQSAGNK